MSHPSKRKNSGIYSPGSVVSYAKLRGFKFIAMTYNEPVPFPETCIELTKKAREAEIETVLVTNTTFTPEFIEEYHRSGGRIIRLDLKATLAQMNEFYFRYCGLKIVEGEEVVTGKKILESIKRAKDLGLHLELMTAVTLNSYPLNNVGCSSWTIPQTADWIRENLGAETPWHLTLLVPRRGLSEIDQRYGPQRLDSYARVARSRGLVNVDIYQKMCDCKEGELFKSGGNSCCDKRE
jgi:pyruvate formate lyase activating enzyme